jgi:hypothetical protein
MTDTVVGSPQQMTNAPAGSIPVVGPGEAKRVTNFFESKFFKRVNVGELLTLASKSRGDDRVCHFGHRALGVNNVVFFIVFDDGVEWVEWVAMLPKVARDGNDNNYLKFEYATMMFAQEIGVIPVPKVYGYCFNRNNPVNSP